MGAGSKNYIITQVFKKKIYEYLLGLVFSLFTAAKSMKMVILIIILRTKGWILSTNSRVVCFSEFNENTHRCFALWKLLWLLGRTMRGAIITQYMVSGISPWGNTQCNGYVCSSVWPRTFYAQCMLQIGGLANSMVDATIHTDFLFRLVAAVYANVAGSLYWNGRESLYPGSCCNSSLYESTKNHHL